jgi:aminoglycoside phosphotransferase (APT) family kinase protein
LREPIPALIQYDAEYYLGWARRALRFAAKLSDSLPWLPALCARFEDLIPHLLASPATVIHGEFYPQNVLVHAGSPHPVDWESAAVAAGEIDLASLTDRWPKDTRSACERAYRQARWPSGTPAHFLKALEVARIYIQLRWLGDWGEVSEKNCHWRFDQLRAYGQRMGLIEH